MTLDEILRKIGESSEIITFSTTPARAFIAVAQLQLALKHPENTGAGAEIAREIAANLTEVVCQFVPEAKELIEQGLNPSYDVTREYAALEFGLKSEGDRPTQKTVEVHNVYTLYELNEDGSKAEKSLLALNRPQDWGDPERWHYYRCKIKLWHGETAYINHCHVWQEVDRTPTSALQEIAPYLFMVMQPGVKRELCGRDYLSEDDFWDSGLWGPMPPVFKDQDDYDYDPYPDETYQDPIPVGGSLYLWRVWHPDQAAAVIDAQTNPFNEPPIDNAQYLYDLTKEGDRFAMRCEDDEPFYGLLFGTQLEGTPTLNPAWAERGWKLESQGEMKKLAN